MQSNIEFWIRKKKLIDSTDWYNVQLIDWPVYFSLYNLLYWTRSGHCLKWTLVSKILCQQDWLSKHSTDLMDRNQGIFSHICGYYLFELWPAFQEKELIESLFFVRFSFCGFSLGRLWFFDQIPPWNYENQI